MSDLPQTREQLEATIGDILIDYGGRDKNGTYTSGQYDLLVSRLASEFVAMPNPTQPMNEEELKKAIKYIFGYDEEETTRGEFNSFNRHPEYVFIQDITKKHTTGKSYHAIEKQLLELMQNDRNAAIREARKPLEEILDRQGWNRCDDCNDFIPINDECLCENCDAMFHEGCAGYTYDGDGEYPAESAYAICKKCYSQSQPNAKEEE